MNAPDRIVPPADLNQIAASPVLTEPQPQIFTHAQVLRVLSGVLTCILLAAIDQTVVIPAVPAIAADLNGFDHLSWIVSAYLLTSTCATPIYGKLSDIYGRRAMLLPAIVLFVIASALCAMSINLWQLIASRALQGLGGAGLMAMAQATIADIVAPRERGRYQGYMAGTWASASVAGPIVGGWLTDHISWHWIFWINLPIGAIAYVLTSRALRTLRHVPRPARIDYAGATLLTLCITATLLTLSWGGNEYAWSSPQIIVAASAAIVLLVVLCLQQRVATDPLLPPRLFSNKVIASGIAVAFLGSATLLGGTFLLPLFFQLVRGADAATSGSMIVPFMVAGPGGAYLSGQFSRRLGKTKGIMVAGLMLAVASFAVLSTVGADTPTLLILGVVFMAGLGLGTCMPTSMVIVQNAAARPDIGAATGALLLLRSMGAAFGSTLVGAALVGAFAAGLQSHGVTMQIDLSALRGREGAVLNLDPAVAAIARDSLASGFHMAFGICAGLAVAALVICLVMRDMPLRSGETGNR
jgi:EmrB/QacA subfamily drug resistance transporter